MNLLLRIAATAVAVAVAAWLIPGIEVAGGLLADTIVTLVVIAVVFGLVNALVKPLATFVSGCLILLTFGLFLLIVNAGMLLLTSWICHQIGVGFSVEGWWPAILGSIIISVVSGLINGLTGATRRSASS